MLHLQIDSKALTSVDNSNFHSPISSLISQLKQCTISRDLVRGSYLHNQAISTSLLPHPCISTSLINMYARCGDMTEAQKLFDNMQAPDVIAWTALISGYAQARESELALQLFHSMDHSSSCPPNARTYVAAVSALVNLATDKNLRTSTWLTKGRLLHAKAVKTRCCDIFVESRLIDMYSKLGSIEEARQVFDNMKKRNLVAWTALLQGYVENDQCELALEVFQRLSRQPGIPLDSRVYVAALSACASLARKENQRNNKARWLQQGRALHAGAVSTRCCNIFVENTLVDLYSSCGSMDSARDVFDGIVRRDHVSWNALLQGYVENGQCTVALELFDCMQRVMAPSPRSYIAALSACSGLGRLWLVKGKSLHADLTVKGMVDDIFVATTVVDMYSKVGSMVDAHNVFESMVERNVVSWTALIMGYVRSKESKVAMELVGDMDSCGVEKNFLTYLAAVMACTDMSDGTSGRKVHAEIERRNLERNVTVANSLVDLYAKCGSMDVARQVFDAIPRKTIVSWTALMCGYSLEGDTDRVFEAFERMKAQGIAPDEVSTLCILTACSHAGQTSRGRECFSALQGQGESLISLQHYNCLVDLLGRANCLEEAMEVIKAMPFQADVVTWTCILSSCERWKNASLGKVAYEALLCMSKES